jgi:calcineurin-like phosphoesterase family protein
MREKLYKDLYLEWLGKEEPYSNGMTRKRVRKISTWEHLGDNPILPHRKQTDLQYAADGCLADGRYVWLWSDQHFGHNNIINFSNRPYPNVKLMEECLIGNYNDYVSHNDICIWVGDVAFLKDDDTNNILHQLNGYKILILGNHDVNRGKIKKLHFDEIHLMQTIEIPVKDGRMFDLVLTHYPMHNLPDRNCVNIHGHEHVAFMHSAASPKHINVNCELHNYKPIGLQSIIDLINKRIDDEKL